MTDRCAVQCQPLRLNPGQHRLRWLPDGLVRLLLCVEPPLLLVSADQPFTAALFGVHTRPRVADLHGAGLALLIALEPLAAFSLGIGMRDLVNAVLDLRQTSLAGLAVVAAASPRRSVGPAVRSWLEQAVRAGRAYSPDVARAWRELARTRGRIAVTALAAHVNLGQRQLEQRFREQIGVAPKVVARVFRFSHARRLLASGLPTAKVATECGYFDHAHLCHEFQAMAGLTPTTFQRSVND